MKNYKILLFTFLIVPTLIFSQDKAKDSIVDKPERPAFESSYIIDNQTNVLLNKNTLEVMMQHRFGQIDEDNSLLGIYGAGTNIRLAVSYGILDWVTIGYGITKRNRVSDFSLKVGILEQTRSDRTPLSITYYGNMGIDGRSGDANDGLFLTKQDRYSYYHQLIFARRFSSKISLQLSPMFSHFNAVDNGFKNDRISIALGGRYKVSPQTSILLDFTLPLTVDIAGPDTGDYDKPGLSIGAEFATSSHAFQIFLSNYTGIVQQYNNMKNVNEPFTDFVIGFNITRNYNF